MDETRTQRAQSRPQRGLFPGNPHVTSPIFRTPLNNILKDLQCSLKIVTSLGRTWINTKSVTRGQCYSTASQAASCDAGITHQSAGSVQVALSLTQLPAKHLAKQQKSVASFHRHGLLVLTLLSFKSCRHLGSGQAAFSNFLIPSFLPVYDPSIVKTVIKIGVNF